MNTLNDQTCLRDHSMPAGARFCPHCGAAARAFLPGAGSADVTSPTETSTASLETATVGDPTPPRPRRRKKALVASLTVVVLVLAAAATWFFAFRTTDEDRYVTDLTSANLINTFPTADVAIAQGHAFCTKLESGASQQGFKSQRLAVKNLCPQFLRGFVVIPTPLEQQTNLTTQLRDSGLGGKFPSDAAAVAHAKSVCSRLDNGGSQQGPEVDAIAVSVYCDKYSAGFKTLQPIVVHGSMTLLDYDASTYFPSISGGANSCSGDGGYSDIGPGTEVVVKNSAGRVLTTSQLGRGSGYPPVSCEFKFSFTVMDGEPGKYSIEVANRGALHYTAAQLKIPDTVEITLGG